MNDSTLPPQSRTTATKTGPRRAGVAAGTTAATSRQVRAKKVRGGGGGLRKGFGLHDWNLLVRNSKDLAQRGNQGMRASISMEEVAQHNKPHDGWMVLHGKVYNLSPYLHYHPGGVDILKPCLGKDGTALFEKYHRWVNADGLIGVLQLGYLAVESKHNHDDDDDNNSNNYIMKGVTTTSSSSSSYLSNNHGFAVPAPRPPQSKKQQQRTTQGIISSSLLLSSPSGRNDQNGNQKSESSEEDDDDDDDVMMEL